MLAQEGGYARTYSAFCLHATLAGALQEAKERVLTLEADLAAAQERARIRESQDALEALLEKFADLQELGIAPTTAPPLDDDGPAVVVEIGDVGHDRRERGRAVRGLAA